MSRARIAQLAGALAATLVVAASASPAALACARGYSYAGLYATSPSLGVAASLSMLRPPEVAGGHVAAWVGVGGPGLGPNGTDEWLQVGLASFGGSPETSLYYELALPGQQPRYVELASGIQPGQEMRVGLLELPFAPNTWIVVSPAGLAGPFYLPRQPRRLGPDRHRGELEPRRLAVQPLLLPLRRRAARPRGRRVEAPPRRAQAAGPRLARAALLAVELQRPRGLIGPGLGYNPSAATARCGVV